MFRPQRRRQSPCDPELSESRTGRNPLDDRSMGRIGRVAGDEPRDGEEERGVMLSRTRRGGETGTCPAGSLLRVLGSRRSGLVVVLRNDESKERGRVRRPRGARRGTRSCRSRATLSRHSPLLLFLPPLSPFRRSQPRRQKAPTVERETVTRRHCPQRPRCRSRRQRRQRASNRSRSRRYWPR